MPISIVLWICVLSLRALVLGKESSACQGSNVYLSCEAGAMINILGDFYGLSGMDECRYRAGDSCIIISKPAGSDIKSACNGKSTCTFKTKTRGQVTCNDGRSSNYFQVEYECIERSDAHDICRSRTWVAEAGFLVSPAYPGPYTRTLDCMCFLLAPQEGASVKLNSLEVELPASCADAVAVRTDGGVAHTLCGRAAPTYVSKVVALHFTSTTTATKGFLLYYTVDSGKTMVTCGPRHALDTDAMVRLRPGAGRPGGGGVDAFWNSLGPQIKDPEPQKLPELPQVLQPRPRPQSPDQRQEIGAKTPPGVSPPQPGNPTVAGGGAVQVVSACAGGELALRCPPRHVINVLGDMHGRSPAAAAAPGSCQPGYGDRCVVEVPRNASIPVQMCSGRQSCVYTFKTSYVRTCPGGGGLATNYQQLTYECVQEASIHSMCVSGRWSAPALYVSSPGYPPLYPRDVDCRCSVGVDTPLGVVTVATQEFALVARSPCADYLALAVDGGPQHRVCGFTAWAVRGKQVHMHFHSVHKGFKGFLLKVSANRGNVILKCGDDASTTMATIPAPVRPPTAPETWKPLPPTAKRGGPQVPSSRGGSIRSRGAVAAGKKAVLPPSAAKGEASSACAGQTLHLFCQQGEVINVLQEFHGRSPAGAACAHTPSDDCVVPVNIATSPVKTRCNGLNYCSFDVVEERACPGSGGAVTTNYQQAQYECIKDSWTKSVCAEGLWAASSGYLTSPAYPAAYPAAVHCACSLEAGDAAAVITLTTEEVRIPSQADSPCVDWVDVRLDGVHEARVCTPQPRRTYSARRTADVVMQTARSVPKGFLFRFDVDVGDLTVACGPIRSQVRPPPPGKQGPDAGGVGPPRDSGGGALTATFNINLNVRTPGAGKPPPPPLPEYRTRSACFGQLLDFTCGVGEVISIVDDFYGRRLPTAGDGAGEACAYSQGDCVVRTKGSTSALDEFCSGRNSCVDRMVPQMLCGGATGGVTEYQHVVYQCVPMSQLVSVTSTHSVIHEGGFVTSPNYPRPYPAAPAINATCTMAAEKGKRLEVVVSHLSLATASSPRRGRPRGSGLGGCGDHLLVQHDRSRSKLCGKAFGKYEASFVRVVFHTDGSGGPAGMGFLLSYKGIDGSSVKLECNPPAKKSKPRLPSSAAILPSGVKTPASNPAPANTPIPAKKGTSDGKSLSLGGSYDYYDVVDLYETQEQQAIEAQYTNTDKVDSQYTNEEMQYPQQENLYPNANTDTQQQQNANIQFPNVESEDSVKGQSKTDVNSKNSQLLTNTVSSQPSVQGNIGTLTPVEFQVKGSQTYPSDGVQQQPSSANQPVNTDSDQTAGQLPEEFFRYVYRSIDNDPKKKGITDYGVDPNKQDHVTDTQEVSPFDYDGLFESIENGQSQQLVTGQPQFTKAPPLPAVSSPVTTSPIQPGDTDPGLNTGIPDTAAGTVTSSSTDLDTARPGVIPTPDEHSSVFIFSNGVSVVESDSTNDQYNQYFDTNEETPDPSTLSPIETMSYVDYINAGEDSESIFDFEYSSAVKTINSDQEPKDSTVDQNEPKLAYFQDYPFEANAPELNLNSLSLEQLMNLENISIEAAIINGQQLTGRISANTHQMEGNSQNRASNPVEHITEEESLARPQPVHEDTAGAVAGVDWPPRFETEATTTMVIPFTRRPFTRRLPDGADMLSAAEGLGASSYQSLTLISVIVTTLCKMDIVC